MFMGVGVTYDVASCDSVITFSREHGADNWSCYVFDLTRSCVNFYDPCIQGGQMASLFMKHGPKASRMMWCLIHCMRLVLGSNMADVHSINIIPHTPNPCRRLYV